MIFACKYCCLSRVLVNYWKGPVPTDIEESIDISLAVANDEKWISCDLILGVLSRCIELRLVAYNDPCLGENRAAFQLIELWFPKPRRR